MKKTENLEDLYNAMLEAQEADMEARGMMDAPDSLQIAGITEEELEADLDDMPSNDLTDEDLDAWAAQYDN